MGFWDIYNQQEDEIDALKKSKWVYIITKKVGELDTKVVGYRCYKTRLEAIQAIFDDHKFNHRFPAATIDNVGKFEVLATSSFGSEIVYRIEGMLIE